jgi:hypothetical protein
VKGREGGRRRWLRERIVRGAGRQLGSQERERRERLAEEGGDTETNLLSSPPSSVAQKSELLRPAATTARPLNGRRCRYCSLRR